MRIRLVTIFVCLVAAASAQKKVDLGNSYYRLLCVLPLTGSGTPQDPRRPEYVPVPVRGQAPSRSGILAYQFIGSDDGKFALVEIVARDRAAVQAILADKRPNVKVFEKGKARQDEIVTEFKKLRKDFDHTKLGVNVP